MKNKTKLFCSMFGYKCWPESLPRLLTYQPIQRTLWELHIG